MTVLAGRAALVTGGGRGIGRAIAGALAAAGADVALLARTPDELDAAAGDVAARGRRALVRRADVTDVDAVAAAVRAAEETFGHVDILVNNAGVQGPIGPLVDAPVGEWIRAVDVNLVGTFLVTRAVLPGMIARGRGKIVNLSGGGASAGRPFFSAYAASKAAVVRLTETLAAEVRGHGIDVNAVAPGGVNTRMTEEVLAAGARAGADRAQAERQRASGGVPAERAAALVVFLASPASDGLTGRLISAVYDDWETLPGRIAGIMASDAFTLRRLPASP